MARKKSTSTKIEERVRVEELAERVKMLLGFCATLIPELDLLKELVDSSSDRASTVMSAAPIIMAIGMDWEEKEFQTKLEAKRAAALFNLVSVVDTTEKERVEFFKGRASRQRAMEDFRRATGI